MELVLLAVIFTLAAFLRYERRLRAALLAHYVRKMQQVLPLLEEEYKRSDAERGLVVLRRIAIVRHDILMTEAQYIRIVRKF